MTGSDERAGPAGLMLPLAALAQLMPLYLWLSAAGVIRAVGPTLRKVLGRDPTGCGLFDLFDLRRPADLRPRSDLGRLAGSRVQLQMRDPPGTALRGLAMPLAGDGGLLLNLSFGIGVAEAVRRHDLTNADFAPTDLAVEMLYLAEAKTAVMQELHALNCRLQQAKATAEQLALTDTLTGLSNRRAMEQAVAQLLQAGTAFALAQVDLDFFKQVNDSLGHAAGDHVLHEVSRVLCDETRTGDIVARVGGDEFVLVFPGLSRMDGVAAIAQRIITRLSTPIAFAGQECRISASIGMTLSRLYAEPRLERMLADADRALYAAKSDGRSRAMPFRPDPQTPGDPQTGPPPPDSALDDQALTCGTEAASEAKKP